MFEYLYQGMILKQPDPRRISRDPEYGRVGYFGLQRLRFHVGRHADASVTHG